MTIIWAYGAALAGAVALAFTMDGLWGGGSHPATKAEKVMKEVAEAEATDSGQLSIPRPGLGEEAGRGQQDVAGLPGTGSAAMRP